MAQKEADKYTHNNIYNGFDYYYIKIDHKIDFCLRRNNVKLPIEISKTALKLYKHWIPAYAGMTPVG